jgi:hypothetical protein
MFWSDLWFEKQFLQVDKNDTSFCRSDLWLLEINKVLSVSVHFYRLEFVNLDLCKWTLFIKLWTFFLHWNEYLIKRFKFISKFKVKLKLRGRKSNLSIISSVEKFIFYFASNKHFWIKFGLSSFCAVNFFFICYPEF